MDKEEQGFATERLPQDDRWQMWDSIETRVKSELSLIEYSPELARQFNFLLDTEFRRAGMETEFFGEYFLDPVNPENSRVFEGRGTEACISGGFKPRASIIGRAFRTGKHQYTPDTRKDPDHQACSKEMGEEGVGGTEIVLLSWANPYPRGKYENQRIPIAALDIDIKGIIDAFESPDLTRLRDIWYPIGKKMFQGDPDEYARAMSKLKFKGNTVQRFNLGDMANYCEYLGGTGAGPQWDRINVAKERGLGHSWMVVYDPRHDNGNPEDSKKKNDYKPE